MSESKRIELREAYIQGWYAMDTGLSVGACSETFIFDDPAEPEPVTRDGLAAYMLRWDQRTRALGADNQWRLTHEVRQDDGELLIDWEWWELLGTDLEGAAFVLTGNDGVLLERITYFER